MKPLLAVLLLAAPLLAGCSASQSPAGATTPPTDGEGRYVIKMTSALTFSPANAKVPANSTVVWVLDGPTPHDVTAADRSWSSDEEGGKIGGSGGKTTYSRTFPTKGVVPYVCLIHESTGMKGTLTVE